MARINGLASAVVGFICLLAVAPRVTLGQEDPTWDKFEAELRRISEGSVELKTSFADISKTRLSEYFETDTPSYDRYHVLGNETVRTLARQLKKKKASEAVLLKLQDPDCVLGIAQDPDGRESYYVYLVPISDLAKPGNTSKLVLQTEGGRQLIVRQKVYARKFGDFDYTSSVTIPLKYEALARANRAVSTAIQVCAQDDPDPFAR